MYSDIKAQEDGTKVTIAGYMSVASPYDGSCAYLIDSPLNNVTDVTMVPIYPAEGTALLFTEKCIRVTGTIRNEPVENDARGLSYAWYIDNCSYEIIEPTLAIKTYNAHIDNGTIKVLDEWLSLIFAGIGDTTKAEKIDTINYETRLLQAGDMTDIKDISASLSSLTIKYNEWIDSGCTDDTAELNSAYSEVTASVSNWLQTLKVKGDE